MSSRNRSLKKNIVESVWTPFVALFIAAMVWTLTGPLSVANWAGFAVTVLVAYAVRIVVSRNALIRIRTWITPAFFLLFSASITHLHVLAPVHLAGVWYAVALFFLLQSYQQIHAERWVFHAFFFLAIASLFFPKLLFASVFFWFSMTVQLGIFSLRALLASLLGLFLPLELMAVLAFAYGRVDLVEVFVCDLVGFHPLATMAFPDVRSMAGLVLLVVVFVASALHFIRTSFNDKMSVRLHLYVLMLQAVAFMVAAVLQQPSASDYLFMALLAASPLVGHYLALSRSVPARVFFNVLMLLLLILTVFNQWICSLIFS